MDRFGDFAQCEQTNAAADIIYVIAVLDQYSGRGITAQADRAVCPDAFFLRDLVQSFPELIQRDIHSSRQCLVFELHRFANVEKNVGFRIEPGFELSKSLVLYEAVALVLRHEADHIRRRFCGAEGRSVGQIQFGEIVDRSPEGYHGREDVRELVHSVVAGDLSAQEASVLSGEDLCRHLHRAGIVTGVGLGMNIVGVMGCSGAHQLSFVVAGGSYCQIEDLEDRGPLHAFVFSFDSVDVVRDDPRLSISRAG